MDPGIRRELERAHGTLRAARLQLVVLQGEVEELVDDTDEGRAHWWLATYLRDVIGRVEAASGYVRMLAEEELFTHRR